MRHENCGFNYWLEFAAETPLKNIDAKLLKDFATWRLLKAEEAGKELSERSISLNILALKPAAEWAAVENLPL